jgi:hypothetical protein
LRIPEGSFDGGVSIWEFEAPVGELGLHDEAVDVFQLGHLLQGVVLGVFFQEFVEGVGHQHHVLDFREVS